MKVILTLNIIAWVYYIVMVLSFCAPIPQAYYNLYLDFFGITVFPMVLFSVFSFIFALVSIVIKVRVKHAKGILLYALLSLLLLVSCSLIYFSIL